MESLKKMFTGLLLAAVASTSFAGNMYVYKDKGGQVLLNNVNPSGNFDKFTKKVKVDYYRDSSNGESNPKENDTRSLDDHYLDAGFNMDTINMWRHQRAENDEIARKLALKPSAAIGMTKSQVRNNTNWGSPNYIKTTIDSHGKSEQWVYGDREYLYFKNGKLTSIQY